MYVCHGIDRNLAHVPDWQAKYKQRNEERVVYIKASITRLSAMLYIFRAIYMQVGSRRTGNRMHNQFGDDIELEVEIEELTLSAVHTSPTPPDAYPLKAYPS